MSTRECSTTNERLMPCPMLFERMAPGMGIEAMVVIEERTGRAVSVRRGAMIGRGKKQVLLNFCPWCGVDLRPAFESMPRQEAKP